MADTSADGAPFAEVILPRLRYGNSTLWHNGFFLLRERCEKHLTDDTP
ncbi:MAG: hypothetical protein WAV46_04345 [Candidatus Moraniibacteriota bacterium]